ncbi:hypothetical protein AN1V17_36310 [Vallitalea sediminicola]
MENYPDNYRKAQRNTRRKQNNQIGKGVILFLISCSLIAFMAYKIINPNNGVTNNIRSEEINFKYDREVTGRENITTSDSLEDYPVDLPNREKLIELAKEYPDVKTILENAEEYSDELLELVVRNPETIKFVLDYPNQYPALDNKSSIDISKEYQAGGIPLFLQWDQRWGYYNYGDSPIGLSGCGPTVLSMVIVALTGDTDKNPKVIADFSYENGYFVEGAGSSWSLMSDGAQSFGLQSKELPLNEKTIKSTLRDGKPIIVSLRPGDFTTTGHFVVMTGITDEGKVIVNDPNSIERSNKEWDMEVFMKQSKNLWAFSS